MNAVEIAEALGAAHRSGSSAVASAGRWPKERRRTTNVQSA
jgi:hypothetical protein